MIFVDPLGYKLSCRGSFGLVFFSFIQVAFHHAMIHCIKFEKIPTYVMFVIKVHIFREGHNFLRNLHRRFVLCSNGQIYVGDFAKFCGRLRIYEL